METNRYPAGYLADCRKFLSDADDRDVSEERPARPSTRSQARIVTSFLVTLIASLAPMGALVASLWS